LGKFKTVKYFFFFFFHGSSHKNGGGDLPNDTYSVNVPQITQFVNYMLKLVASAKIQNKMVVAVQSSTSRRKPQYFDVRMLFLPGILITQSWWSSYDSNFHWVKYL